mmetsp:Transcript_29744/g.50823  ORF Transcript_29744/g.50823 Transcript_29744/m.50823 type:complete len:447 (-) Transcript_29744:280-1620(-)|eukprot:CAMPEP_0206159610 /NCGR_PEP_ID=MMETSP1474-20131121/5993_1 /ASSEMBLY_ACC=CAM_ASM_001110 /TAXON_ID=97495 /ORGANISM="Imantonia sp., Strain RCC918" /LENGTH=446 /DNA_ID=CAMNT_0053560437 /DNA_START=43 /DNA_END=1383 /DNA_ORIENTATION=-
MAERQRFALALHGRVGTLREAPKFSIRRSHNASRRVLRLCGRSVQTNILRQGQEVVDLFIHSWNPESASFIDEFYGQPRASLHEPVVPGLPPAQSQALSISRAASLVVAQEREMGRNYTLVLVMRLDAAVASPVSLSRMSPSHIWFAQHCCLDGADTDEEKSSARAACPADFAAWQPGDHWQIWSHRIARRCGLSSFNTRRCGKKRCRTSLQYFSSEVNEAYFVPDWWFAASSAVVSSWAEIAAKWSSVYVRRACELRIIAEGGDGDLWSHFVWAIHVRDVLRMGARVRYVPASSLRVSLARFVWAQALAPRGCPLDIMAVRGMTTPSGDDGSGERSNAGSTHPCPLARPAAGGEYCCGRKHWRACGVNASEQAAACAAGRAMLRPFVAEALAWGPASPTAAERSVELGRRSRAGGAHRSARLGGGLGAPRRKRQARARAQVDRGP